MKTLDKVFCSLSGIVIVIAIWHFAVRMTGTNIFPSPLSVARGVEELLARGLFWKYVRDSLLRVSSGYLLAAATGIPFGILLGWFPSLNAAFNPLIQMLRPISPLAWMPMAVIWFGVGNITPIFLIYLAAFFPIVVSTMNAVRNVPRVLLLTGSNFGLSRPAMLRRVVFPATVPSVLTGLRLALGVAWLVVVAAEMIAVDSGLGYLIIDSRNAGKRYDLVVAGMLVIGIIGLLLDLVLRRLERLRSVRWGYQN